MRQGPFTLYDSETGERIQVIGMTQWDAMRESAKIARAQDRAITVVDVNEDLVGRYTRFGARIKETMADMHRVGGQ